MHRQPLVLLWMKAGCVNFARMSSTSSGTDECRILNSRSVNRVVLGVTGGHRGLQGAELTRLFVKAGAVVDVVMTEAATRFVTPLTFQALSGRGCSRPLGFGRGRRHGSHRRFQRRRRDSRRAGQSDFIVEAREWRGRRPPVHAVPRAGMPIACGTRNESPDVVQRRHASAMSRASRRRRVVLGSRYGELACKEKRRRTDARSRGSLRRRGGSLQPKVLAGKRVLLTAGPTFEAIDPVRGITNSSSGKMGFALARRGVRRART
jgi:phosphopantothenoylcysteine decarboxylase/phosphopantothenate--cysteine ligase